MLLLAHTPQHKQKNSALIKFIIECESILYKSARDRIRTWTCEFMDKNPQKAEEQLVMTMDKALPRYKS